MSFRSVERNLVGWGTMNSDGVGPASSEESESALIPIEVADRITRA